MGASYDHHHHAGLNGSFPQHHRQHWAGIQSLFGANISIYTELAEKAREEAFNLMVQHAASAGANAVIGMR